MEKTYNDIIAENEALKKQLHKLTKDIATEHAIADMWKKHYYNARNEATGDKVSLRLWREFVGKNFPEWLDVFSALCEESANAPKAMIQSGCKIISINKVRK